MDDSLEELSRQSRNDLRKPLRLVFIGEEGVDAGGLKKEWFQLLMEQMLDPDFGLVTHNEETNALLLNAHSLEPEDHFFLLGLIVGLALYNNVLINFPLDPSIYKKLLGKDLTLSDFEQTYPRLGQSLRQLISFKEGSEGSIEETFCLTFTFDVLTPTGIEAIELIPGGASTPVTVHNREEFVNRVVSYHLNESIVRKFDSFGRGFKTIISGPVIKLLEAIELERMICGCPSDLHFETLRGHTKYDGGFHDQSKTVIWFWQVVQEMDSESGKKLLKFVSGSDRIPIGGLAKLRFIIQKNTVSDRRLPTAHTCFNTLLLPEYSSLVILKERLMVAIENAQGFGLK